MRVTMSCTLLCVHARLPSLLGMEYQCKGGNAAYRPFRVSGSMLASPVSAGCWPYNLQIYQCDCIMYGAIAHKFVLPCAGLLKA
jgi:hypothetical protein